MDATAQLHFSRPIYGRLYEGALPFLGVRRNELHTRVCYRFALLLLESEGGNADVVVPAILLHDIGWSRIPEHLHLTAFGPHVTNPGLQRVHETEGAAMAGELLAAAGYPRPESEHIVRIVSRHDTGTQTASLEEQIVKDADKLWRVSREGLAVDSERFGLSRAHNLARLESQIEGWFLTPGGKALARREWEARRDER